MTQALPREMQKPVVPISYVQLLRDLLQSRGVTLEIPEIDTRDGGPTEARVPLARYRELCLQALERSGDPGLGLAFGLGAPITSHGLFGYGLMSQPTLDDAFDFMARFASPLRLPAWHLSLEREGEGEGEGGEVVIDAVESVRFEALHVFACEQLLASITTGLRTLLPDVRLRLLFDYPEPGHMARYRDQLPDCRFDTGVTQVRVDAADTRRPLPFANPTAARMAETLCLREAGDLAPDRDIVARVLQVLTRGAGHYPRAEEAAAELCLSPRTLARRLSGRNTSYRELLDQVRRRDAMQLLRDSGLSVEEIAARLGYSSGANFARALKSWTGLTPGEARER